MNIYETVQLALKAIIANRLRSFLTILGIVIGVTSVILLISVVTGLNTFITKQISSLGSNIIFVIPGKTGGGRGPGGIQVNKLKLQDAQNLALKLNNQADVSASVQSVATIKSGNKSSKDATIMGGEANLINIIQSIKIAQGRFFNASEADSGRNVVLIGPTVAKNVFGEQSSLGKSVIIGKTRYTVIGTLEARGSTFGIDQDNSAIIPLQAALKDFGIENIQTIYISANSAEQVDEVQLRATKILSQRLSTDDFTVQTQAQTLSTISQITGVLTAALGGIAAISLIVGGIGIMNIMLVSVTERTKEIGLRKALGAKPADIRNQFLVEALTLSGLGGIIGILLGMLLAFIVNFFFTTTIPLWSVALSFGFSMIVGVVFGVAPAIRAAKLDPITALRYE